MAVGCYDFGELDVFRREFIELKAKAYINCPTRKLRQIERIRV